MHSPHEPLANAHCAVTGELPIAKIMAKVSDHNRPSLDLFTRKLGFRRIGHSPVFSEVTLQLAVDDRLKQELRRICLNVQRLNYD